MRWLMVTWDFFFGAMCIGAAPIVAGLLTGIPLGIVVSRFGSDGGLPALLVDLVAIPAMLCLPVAAIWVATKWRASHRVSPKWTLSFEVLGGLIGSAAFCLYALGIWTLSSVQ